MISDRLCLAFAPSLFTSLWPALSKRVGLMDVPFKILDLYSNQLQLARYGSTFQAHMAATMFSTTQGTHRGDSCSSNL